MEAFYGNWAQLPQIYADERGPKKLAANLREVRGSQPLFTFGNSGDLGNIGN
ncbi:MAG TPA: hypothetical protein VGJ33_21235 [Candidatus Angelobacter sp.]|jgi:hypothetical protein